MFAPPIDVVPTRLLAAGDEATGPLIARTKVGPAPLIMSWPPA
jgi:hypothetical protein